MYRGLGQRSITAKGRESKDKKRGEKGEQIRRATQRNILKQKGGPGKSLQPRSNKSRYLEGKGKTKKLPRETRELDNPVRRGREKRLKKWDQAGGKVRKRKDKRISEKSRMEET